MPILIKGRGVRRLQRKKQNFIQGAFILMLASLLVKVIGAFFQIPLLNMIGGKDSPAFGMFSAAYRVYTAMLMISTVGVPAALAKMVAEATARGREHEVRRTVRVAGSIFIPLGAVCSVVLFLGAGTFASWIKSADSRLAVMAIAPSVLMVAVLAVFRGYYQGRSNMVPTAVSQVIESLGKLFIGLGLAYYAVQHNFFRSGSRGNDRPRRYHRRGGCRCLHAHSGSDHASQQLGSARAGRQRASGGPSWRKRCSVYPFRSRSAQRL